jgi:hypothetical protein
MNHEFREFREFTRTAEKKTRFCHKQPFTNLARIQISKLSVSRAQSRQERADVINGQWVPLIGANTRARLISKVTVILTMLLTLIFKNFTVQHARYTYCPTPLVVSIQRRSMREESKQNFGDCFIHVQFS